ncbi:Prostaglandin E synthase 2 [Armadillidium nasatum]|uniref:Prostaglandin E synthase 2 n=1 Tax=Armadillidium nasatum TaxID=96803 RepID=A0A5N5TG27_9CRUS|nr:Prostaglandin E synthase 2 [Armadillidium nasatum]
MSIFNNSLFTRGISRFCKLYSYELPSVKYCEKSKLLNINNVNKCYFSVNAVKSPPKSKYPRFLMTLGIGFGVGTIATGLYLYNTYRNINTAILNTATGEEYFLEKAPVKHTVARSIYNPLDKSGFKITLYQFQTCPFCCKVRTFLDYFGFSYDIVEVNSVTHKQTKWTPYRKVPFIVIEQEGTQTVMQLKDSSMIISALMSFINTKDKHLEEIVKGFPTVCFMNEDGKKKTDIMNKYSIFYGERPPGKSDEEILEEKKWRKWVDDVYVHTLSPNVYRTMNESFQAFNWFSEAGDWKEHFKTWERLLVIYVGSLAMYLIGKRLKKRHGLKDDVRSSFYEETNIWLKEVKNRGGKFFGGDEPNLADLGVYGVLTAVEGCNAFQDLLTNTAINDWFSDMKTVVENHQGEKYLNQRGSNL